MIEQQIAPASAKREYSATPLSLGSAFVCWMAASSFVEPVELVGEAMAPDALMGRVKEGEESRDVLDQRVNDTDGSSKDRRQHVLVGHFF